MKTRTRFTGLQLSPADRTELQQMQRSRKVLTARVWRRIRVLLLLDGGHTVRATAIAARGYPREISRVGTSVDTSNPASRGHLKTGQLS